MPENGDAEEEQQQQPEEQEEAAEGEAEQTEEPEGPYTWTDASGGEVPEGAVVGGQDEDGNDMYVGRAHHENDLLPGKVLPSKEACFVCWGCAEHAKSEYQVLCGCEVEWVKETGGQIPEGALEAGKTELMEPLYVGRVAHAGTITTGKVHPSHGVCYIPFDGAELSFPEYEVLVVKQPSDE